MRKFTEYVTVIVYQEAPPNKIIVTVIFYEIHSRICVADAPPYV